MIYVDLESLYHMGADILFRVEKLFYRYKIAMKNYLNDVVVVLKVQRGTIESYYKIEEDERPVNDKNKMMSEHWKFYYEDSLLFAVTGSYFMNFDKGDFVCIGVNKFPSHVLYKAHDISW